MRNLRGEPHKTPPSLSPKPVAAADSNKARIRSNVGRIAIIRHLLSVYRNPLEGNDGNLIRCSFSFDIPFLSLLLHQHPSSILLQCFPSPICQQRYGTAGSFVVSHEIGGL